MGDRARFNAPPGWPPVSGDWLPPNDWQPQPSWPAPPAGWVFYIGPNGEQVWAPDGCWAPTVARRVAQNGRDANATSLGEQHRPGDPHILAPARPARNWWKGRFVLGVGILVVLIATAVTLMLGRGSDKEQQFDSEFTALVKKNIDKDVPADQLPLFREMARKGCAAMDNGHSPEELIIALLENSDDKNVNFQSTLAVTLGAKIFCPEHMN